MPIEKHQQVHSVIRDARSQAEKNAAFFGSSKTTISFLTVFAAISYTLPFTSFLFLPAGLIWWWIVSADMERKKLPLFLPEQAGITDFNDPKAGPEGDRGKFSKAAGFFFAGNKSKTFHHIWATAEFLKRHVMLLGTTGAGKTETLMGFFANALLTGSGVIFSDAKGTKEQVSTCLTLARRFGRDDDFFVVNYITGGQPDYGTSRDRYTNTANPVAFANADQITQIFGSFLPTSSGENQTFQDRAMAMFTSVMPALTDLRDNHKVPIGLAEIRKYTGDLREFFNLARDERLHPRSREAIRAFMSAGLAVNLDEFDANGVSYKAGNETTRNFGFSSQYFVRAMTSLVESYRSIYMVQKGEVNFKDAIYNRRIVVVALPSMEKSPQELGNIAKINISNIRGAIASAGGGRLEGLKEETIDNLPTRSLYPGFIILDEFGYQKTEGFPITMAQARGLNFSIVVAGQDFSNFQMGDRGVGDADAIQGNSVLICMQIRNTKEIGSRIAEATGEVDVAIQGGLDRDRGAFGSGYTDSDALQVIRRKKVDPSELTALNKGEAIMIPGGNFEPFKYNCWAPLPKPAKFFQINRYLMITDEARIEDAELQGALQFARLTLNLIEGRDPGSDRKIMEGMVQQVRDKMRIQGPTPGMDPCAAAFYGILSAPADDRPESPLPPASSEQSAYDPGIAAHPGEALPGPDQQDAAQHHEPAPSVADSPAAAHTPIPPGVPKGAWHSNIAPVRVAGRAPKDYSGEIIKRAGGDFFDVEDGDYVGDDLYTEESADELAASLSTIRDTLAPAIAQYDAETASLEAEAVANSVCSATTYRTVSPTPKKANPEDLQALYRGLVARNGGSTDGSGVKSPGSAGNHP